MAMDHATVTTRSRSKRGHVRDSLQAMILEGKYSPGDRLIQQQLAEELNSSVSVIREVLVELSSAGLVETVDNAGFFVGKLDITRLVDSYRVRAVHEGLAARLCCERAGRKDMRELKEMAQQCHELYSSDESDDLDAAVALDRQMHARLIEIAHSEVLTHASQSVWIPVVAVEGETQKARHEQTHLEHLAIIQAIEDNRPDDADRLARKHILNALAAMREQLKIGGAELKWQM